MADWLLVFPFSLIMMSFWYWHWLLLLAEWKSSFDANGISCGKDDPRVWFQATPECLSPTHNRFMESRPHCEGTREAFYLPPKRYMAPLCDPWNSIFISQRPIITGLGDKKRNLAKWLHTPWRRPGRFWWYLRVFPKGNQKASFKEPCFYLTMRVLIRHQNFHTDRRLFSISQK